MNINEIFIYNESKIPKEVITGDVADELLQIIKHFKN